MATPRPGSRVRGSTTGRPIMALLDLLGRRWTLRILWELRDAALTFRALQEACGGTSPTVLNQRIKELRQSGLLEIGERDGYALTPLGDELRRALMPLVDWSTRWAREVARRPPVIARDSLPRERMQDPVAENGTVRSKPPRH
jgi:DNA-binding HxlR family transcriptional regulator